MNPWKLIMTVAAACSAPILLPAATANADFVNLGASQDATIYSSDSTGSTDNGKASGMGPVLTAGADGSGALKRGLIQFNVSSIPEGSTITGVTLTLYLAQYAGEAGGALSPTGGNFGAGSPSRTIELYDLLQPWTEGTSGSGTTNPNGNGQGFTRVTGDTSWDYASYNSADATTGKWNNGSANVHGGNFSSTSSAASTFSSYPGTVSPFTWSSAGMVADVQAWVNGTSTDDGWMIKSDSESTTQSFLSFWSKDGAAAVDNTATANAPVLNITFTPPASVPEPASLTLLISGIPLMMLRRRRDLPRDVH